jgi:hypothetical protein
MRKLQESNPLNLIEIAWSTLINYSIKHKYQKEIGITSLEVDLKMKTDTDLDMRGGIRKYPNCYCCCGNWISFRLQVMFTFSSRPNIISSPFSHLRTETGPVSGKLCFIVL